MAHVRYLASLGRGLTTRSRTPVVLDPSFLGRKIKVAMPADDGRVRVLIDCGPGKVGHVVFFPSMEVYLQSVRREETKSPAPR